MTEHNKDESPQIITSTRGVGGGARSDEQIKRMQEEREKAFQTERLDVRKKRIEDTLEEIEKQGTGKSTDKEKKAALEKELEDVEQRIRQRDTARQSTDEESHTEPKKQPTSVEGDARDTDTEKTSGKETGEDGGKAEHITEKELESENKALSLFDTSVEEVSKHVEGFDKLPHGKRMFVIENLRQLTLADVEEQAASDYHNTTGWRKLVQFIKNSGTPLARAKKQATQETLSAGIETHKDTLGKLVDSAEGMPDAKETEDGSLEIQFFDVSTFPEGSPEREAAEKFNAVATEKTYMPTEWKYDAEHWEGLLRRTGNGPSGLRAWLHKPSRENYEKYHELKSRYDERRKQLLEILRERGDERSASLEMNDLDAQISAHQQLNTHPDSEKALLSLRDDGLWKQVFRNISTGRGVQFGAGFAIRSLSTATFGVLAAPIAGGAISGFRGRSRAWSDLKEKYIADLYKETGGLSEEEQASARKEMREARVAGKLDAEQNIVPSDKLIEKLENITQEAELENLTDLKDPAQQEVLARIQARIGYTTRKLDEGLVNFGKGTNALYRQYQLTQALSHAHVQAGALAGLVEAEAEGETKDAIAKKVDVLNERLNNTLDIRAVRINDARFAQVKRKIVDQALVGAGFGFAGALFGGALDKYDLDEKAKAYVGTYATTWFGWIPNTGEGKGGPIAPEADGRYQQPTNIHPPQETPHYAADVHPPQEASPRTVDIHPPQETPHYATDTHPPQEIPHYAPDTHPPQSFKVTVEPGGSLWSAIEGELGTNEAFQNMNEAQRTYVIDDVKDEFAKMGEKELKDIGISSGNIDRIQAGETIDLSSVMERAGLVEQATENARALSAEQIQSITQNNEAIREALERAEQTGEPLTSEKVEEILKRDVEGAYEASGQEQPPTRGTAGPNSPIEQGAAPTTEQQPTTGQQSAPAPESTPEGTSDTETAEQTPTQTEAEVTRAVNTRLENDLNALFGTENARETIEWGDMKGLPAQKVFVYQPQDAGVYEVIGLEEVVPKMREYLANLSEQTNTTPENTETVEEYIRRALAKTVQ